MSSVHFQVPRGSSSTQIQLSPSLLFKVAAFPLTEPSLCDRPEKVELSVPTFPEPAFIFQRSTSEM